MHRLPAHMVTAGTCSFLHRRSVSLQPDTDAVCYLMKAAEVPDVFSKYKAADSAQGLQKHADRPADTPLCIRL